ncbi:MAG: hypothetical protein AAFN11_18830, partial [Chloroflexota bacterium]
VVTNPTAVVQPTTDTSTNVQPTENIVVEPTSEVILPPTTVPVEATPIPAEPTAVPAEPTIAPTSTNRSDRHSYLATYTNRRR